MNQYAKGIVAVVGAAITAALGIVVPGSGWANALTVLAAVVTAISVYAIPNGAPAPAGEHAPAEDGGEVTGDLLLTVLMVVLIVLIFLRVFTII